MIAFRWSPEFTVFSLRGGPPDGFDGIVDERILATPAGVGLEIEITYTLPMIAEPMRDLTTLPQIARAVHELHASVAPASENPVRIDVALSFPQALAPRIKTLAIHQTWPIGDALFDLDLLGDIFADLCGELRDVLEALAEVYLTEPREGQPNAQDAEEAGTSVQSSARIRSKILTIPPTSTWQTPQRYRARRQWSDSRPLAKSNCWCIMTPARSGR